MVSTPAVAPRIYAKPSEHWAHETQHTHGSRYLQEPPPPHLTDQGSGARGLRKGGDLSSATQLASGKARTHTQAVWCLVPEWVTRNHQTPCLACTHCVFQTASARTLLCKL